jgi:hypothetical protein
MLGTHLHPKTSPVDSTGLTKRETDRRNGITLKVALVEGRYGEQGTTHMHLRAGLLKKPMPGVTPGIC